MKITKLIAVAAAGAAAMASQSAMAADNATADVTATLLNALDVTKTADVRFGTVIKPKAYNSTVTINIYGERAVDSGDAVVQNSPFGMGSFTVSGATGLAYNVQVAGTSGSANGVTLKHAFGVCTGGTSNGSGLTRTITGCTSYGADALKVGAMIGIDTTSTASGAVTAGTIKVTLAYQ